MSEDIQFGLVGFGLFGKHHANAIAQADGARLAAISAQSQASQDAAREDYPTAEIYGDYRQLLDRQDLDAVCVVTPNLTHYEIGKAVLESRKHLLLEKPMALELGHCDTLVRLAQEKELILAVGHELRLSSLWGGAKQLIDDGTIGDPLHVLIELSRFPYRLGSGGWRYDVQRVGNWILEEPIHFFDLARWYLSDRGEPTSIYARANARDPDHPELKDNFSAILNFPDNAYALISQTLGAFGHHQTGKIVGTKGTIWAYWSAADARSDKPEFGLRYGLGDDVTEMQFDKPTGELLELADEVAAMVHCIRTGAIPPCTGNDGRWSTLLCLAAERSVDSGTLVDIGDLVR